MKLHWIFFLLVPLIAGCASSGAETNPGNSGDPYDQYRNTPFYPQNGPTR